MSREDIKDNDTAVKRSLLDQEYYNLNKSISKWKAEMFLYRWLNIILFMCCKIIVPTGALIIAINMISIVLGNEIIDSYSASIISVIVTLFASIDAMLNPSAKKRLAFNMGNELRSMQNKLNIEKASLTDSEYADKLIQVNDEFKKVLDHYSENGY